MKPIASLLFCCISITLSAQLDDYCPCMDPPKYFENSFLDSLLNEEQEMLYPYTAADEPQAIFVTDNHYAEEEPQFISVSKEQVLNVSPSEWSVEIPEKKINVSPDEEDEEEVASRVAVIKQKRKRKRYRVKRQRKFRKYRGKCPRF